MSVLRLGTGRNPLAIARSEWVAQLLRRAGHEVSLVGVRTDGDDAPFPGTTELGTSGVTALRTALVRGDFDLVVHSLEDLPVAGTSPDTLATAETVVAAVPRREDPRDVLVARDGLTLGELPPGAEVGTGSPRREAQVRALGLGLATRAVHGDVDTRLAVVAAGELDAVIMSRAALARLGRLDAVTEALDPIQVLPAPGQGALAVECRVVDRGVAALLTGLDDPDTRACVVAERAVLAGLRAGYGAPVGALAEVVEGQDGPELSLRAVVASQDGVEVLRRSVVGPLDDPAGLGGRLAAVLVEDGAAQLTPLTRDPPELDPPELDPEPDPPHGHPASANHSEATS